MKIESTVLKRIMGLLFAITALPTALCAENVTVTVNVHTGALIVPDPFDARFEAAFVNAAGPATFIDCLEYHLGGG